MWTLWILSLKTHPFSLDFYLQVKYNSNKLLYIVNFFKINQHLSMPFLKLIKFRRLDRPCKSMKLVEQLFYECPSPSAFQFLKNRNSHIFRKIITLHVTNWSIWNKTKCCSKSIGNFKKVTPDRNGSSSEKSMSIHCNFPCLWFKKNSILPHFNQIQQGDLTNTYKMIFD